MNKPINAFEVVSSTDNPFPKVFHEKMGDSEWRGLSDNFGLSQFGTNIEVIRPSGSSGLKHRHTKSEEFIYILSGELILEYGDEIYPMSAGMCIGFKANEALGHRLINRSNENAKFLVVGSRIEGDKVDYVEDDMQWIVKENGDWVAAKKTGELY